MEFPHAKGWLLAHVISLTVLSGPGALAAELPPQTTESGGVTIVVKPVDVSAEAASWRFEVSLSTQSQDLKDDLSRTAVMLNRAAKKQEPPTGWKGDAAGGRNRSGVLTFKPLKPQPNAIELRIQRVGEKAPRVFRWDLNCQCGDPSMHPSSS